MPLPALAGFDRLPARIANRGAPTAATTRATLRDAPIEYCESLPAGMKPHHGGKMANAAVMLKLTPLWPFGQSPSVAWMSASAATAAVSARKMRGPRLRRTTRETPKGSRRARRCRSRLPAQSAGRRRRPRVRFASASSGLAGLRLLVAEHEEAVGRPVASASPSGSTGAISGAQITPHCSQASIALARRRSKLTRATWVWRVITGRKRRAPISTAFCAI